MDTTNLGRFALISVIGTVTLMPLLTLPAMVGVLVDQAGMTERGAGWSASANFLGSAVIGLLMSVHMHRINLRRTASIALVVSIVADLASAGSAGPAPAFFFARSLAGAALGAAYVAAVSSFARFENYERGFGLFVTLQFAVSGLGLYVVPVFSDELGPDGLFLGFAMLDLLALMLVRALPNAIAEPAAGTAGRSEWRVLLTFAALTAIAGFTLFEAANNAQFTYIERFGVSLDLGEHRIGLALLIASLIGIPAAFMIVLIGHRFGTLLPLLGGIAVAMVGLTLLTGTDNYVAYFIGSCCMGWSWAFCLPYIQSLLAMLDRNGSAIAAGTACSTLGSAAGPGMAALVVAGGRYSNVFMLSIALFVICSVCFYYAARHSDGTRVGVAV